MSDNSNHVPEPTAVLPSPAPLSEPERTRLAEAESVVHAGLKTFWEVGRALADIRDNRLYRESHPTFEDYLRERWNISRPSAYRLIEAAAVRENLSPIGDTLPANEAQARPLAGLEPEEQREAWKAALATSGDTPTARDVEAAVADVCADRPDRQPSRAVTPLRLDEIWAKIEHGAGKRLAAALREKNKFWNRRDALKFSELTHARMREVGPLLLAGFQLEEAEIYDPKSNGFLRRLSYCSTVFAMCATASGKDEFEHVYQHYLRSSPIKWIVSIRRADEEPPETK